MSIWSWLFGEEAKCPQPRDTFGFTPEDPILCCLPEGERKFLDALRCPSGHPFRYQRFGSLAGTCPDPPSHLDAFPMLESFQEKMREKAADPAPADCRPHSCVVDVYHLWCAGGEHRCSLHFDMYHLRHPKQPPPKGLRGG